MSELYCPKCGDPIKGEAPFCSYCGHYLGKPKESKKNQRICAVCGTQIKEEALFCSNCGARWVEKEEEPKQEQKTNKTDTVTASSKKFIIIAVISTIFTVGAVIGYINQSSAASSFESLYNREKRNSEYAQSALSSTQAELNQFYSILGVDLEQVNEDERLDEAQKELQELKNKSDTYRDLDELYGYGSENFYADKGVIVLGVTGKTSEELGVYAYIQNATYRIEGSDSGLEAKWSREWDNHKTHVILTAESMGYYTVEFTNDQNSDSFEVLVIVVSSWAQSIKLS